MASKFLLAGALSCTALCVACSGQLSSPPSVVDGAPGPSAGGAGGKAGVTKAALDCSKLHVGYTPLQRISREQYKNSVRDLLGVSFDATLLSDDERVGVFDGNVVAPVTDLVVDEYASAAESVARQAKLEQLVPCDRSTLGDVTCAAQFVEKFGLRAYRRPLSDDENAAYRSLYTAYKASYPDALRVIVQTMLQSPSFLYRAELQANGSAEGTLLDAYELASRLSFFLLSTTPDDKLLGAAASGALLTSDGLTEQASRLIEDERFADTLKSFHVHWLGLEQLGTLTKDATLFPSFSAGLATQMLDETLKFVNHVFREDDAKLDTLLTATYGFPQGELATLYGVTPAASADEPVMFDPKQRAGLLTRPSFLATQAHYNSTAPVLRGKVLIRNVLCAQLPDPPPNVNTTPPNPSANATMREQLTQHQASPSCAGCHTRIDGIGLGLEQFDAIGAYRESENGKQVDSSGELVQSGADLDGKFNNAIELVHKLAESSEVKQCVATQWLRFALGRLESDADQCTLDALFRDFASSDHDLRVLLKTVVLSDAFRNKRNAELAP